ncbi:3-hexulose-6-phosphate synthase [bacterium 1XD8-76]|nr:3-hexulose-6-phosphate synthase [bacterium 1XD8-76]
MKLQLALDDTTLEEAMELIANVRDYVDIIEVGTPMVMEYGMAPVRELKKRFPDKKVLADLKIMDAGKYESEIAFKAGADYITVLGVTDDGTIEGCVEAARAHRGLVVADMICVKDAEERIRRLEELGIDILSVHTGVDQQAAGRTPLDDLKVMRRAVTAAEISVAGGISAETLPAYLEYSPEIVIVGSGITHAENPRKVAEKIYKIVR